MSDKSIRLRTLGIGALAGRLPKNGHAHVNDKHLGTDVWDTRFPMICKNSHPVFSTFYSFIRLFANKRIEYKVSTNKIRALFVDTDRGTLIRLFGYSQLNIKHEELSNKITYDLEARWIRVILETVISRRGLLQSHESP